LSEDIDYIVNAQSLDFHIIGSKDKYPLFLLENIREFGLWDDFVMKNKPLFYHICLFLIILIFSSILCFAGVIIWFYDRKKEEYKNRKQDSN